MKAKEKMNALETQLADLECVVQELSDRVAALTDAVNALTDEVQWRNNHGRDSGEPIRPFALTSMPLDPCADDWQINRVDRDGCPNQKAEHTHSTTKGTLFD